MPRVVGTGRDLSLRVMAFEVYNRDDIYKLILNQFKKNIDFYFISTHNQLVTLGNNIFVKKPWLFMFLTDNSINLLLFQFFLMRFEQFLDYFFDLVRKFFILYPMVILAIFIHDFADWLTDEFSEIENHDIVGIVF